MGRSRGAPTKKIHALVDAERLPIALKLTEGQAHDGRSGRDMLDALIEGQTLLAAAPTTAMSCGEISTNAAHGPTSNPLPASNSLHFESGCALMRRSPRSLLKNCEI
jgi:hypothetical protein